MLLVEADKESQDGPRLLDVHPVSSLVGKAFILYRTEEASLLNFPVQSIKCTSIWQRGWLHAFVLCGCPPPWRWENLGP